MAKTKYVIRVKRYSGKFSRWVIFSNEKKRTIAFSYENYKENVAREAKQFSKDSGIPYSDKILRV